MYQKSLFLVRHHTDGTVVQDEGLCTLFLPSLIAGAQFMNQVGSFTPLLNYLSHGDIKRNEKECEKEPSKHQKRNTRRPLP